MGFPAGNRAKMALVSHLTVMVVAATPDEGKRFSKWSAHRPPRNKSNEAGETTSAPMFFHAKVEEAEETRTLAARRVEVFGAAKHDVFPNLCLLKQTVFSATPDFLFQGF